MIGLIIFLAIAVLIVAAVWKAFQKAGEPGWACLVPIYNIIVVCRIGGKPWWWLFLMCIPLVGIVFSVMVNHGISKNFGFGVGMTVLLTLLPIIGWPVLGFGEAKYLAAPAKA